MAVGRVLVVDGPDKGKVVLLDQPNRSYIIGRGKGTEIKLTDIQASRTHAMFVRKGEKYLCSDLQSRNGTIVNGKVIEGEHDLQPGDRVTVGSTTVEFQVVSSGDSAEVPAVPVAPGAAGSSRPAKTPRPVSAGQDDRGEADDEEDEEDEVAGDPVEVTPLESGITNVVKNAALREQGERRVPTAGPPVTPKPARSEPAPKSAKPAAPAPAKPARAEAPPPPRITARRTEKSGPVPIRGGKGKAVPPAGPPAKREALIPSSDSEVLEALDALDKSFAQAAIDSEYVTEAQIRECSRVQRESANRVSLGMILVEKGHLDFEQLSQLSEIRGEDNEGDPARAQDFLFGRLCVQLGLISPNQLNECMMIQGKKQRDDEYRLLGAIMVEKGFLSQEQVCEVLRTLRTEMIHCPGCDALYKAAEVPAEERDLCMECGASLKG